MTLKFEQNPKQLWHGMTREDTARHEKTREGTARHEKVLARGHGTRGQGMFPTRPQYGWFWLCAFKHGFRSEVKQLETQKSKKF